MEVFLDTDLNELFKIQEPSMARSVPYWTSEAYGFGKYIREYAFYPRKFPLLVFTDHSGPHIVNRFSHYEINTDASVVMFHSPKVVEMWKHQFKKPCFVLYSPFVFYRKKYRIQKSKNAKGTLAYPAHTIPELDDLSNIEEYISQLKNLPEKYQPVSVSLHFHDINKGLHKLFLKHKIPVFTAGNPMDYNFPKEFYATLRNFKYTTSNFLGSYTFYAVEMDIPFFLHGNQPVYSINTNSQLAKESLQGLIETDDMLEGLTRLFETPSDIPTLEQREIVGSTLGLYKGTGRLKFSFILYRNLAEFYARKLFKKIDNRVYKC